MDTYPTSLPPTTRQAARLNYHTSPTVKLLIIKNAESPWISAVKVP